jgi:hypothetical protein
VEQWPLACGRRENGGNRQTVVSGHDCALRAAGAEKPDIGIANVAIETGLPALAEEAAEAGAARSRETVESSIADWSRLQLPSIPLLQPLFVQIARPRREC